MASLVGSMISYLRIPMLAASGLTALLSGALYWKQNELIYPRNIPIGARTEVPRPSEFGLSDFEDLTIPTPDGESLSAFLIRPSNKQFARNITILMFHGNAGNIGHRIPIARALEGNSGCNVLMLQYRGYGLSTGTPDEKGLTIDAQTGLDYIRQRAELRGTKILVYGQSLGGAVSIRLVAKNQAQGDIAGMILENTFLSIRKLIPSAFPPAKYLAPLCHQLWPSEEVLPQITKVPVLFLSGLRDEIVPPTHMKQLYDVCRAEPKIWKELPNGSHNDTVAEPGYFQYIEEFIRNYVE
ncbi:BEM46 family protein-like protein [Cryomyces antarcticus]